MSKATARDIQKSKACTFFPGRLTYKTIFGRPSMPVQISYARKRALRRPKGDKDNHSAARKDMTRVLQCMPPLHVMERVVAFLLLKAGKSDAEQSWMTGDEIIVTLTDLRGQNHGHRSQQLLPK